MKKRRWLPRIGVAAIFTIGIVAAIVWWQERGLDDVAQRLASGDSAGALVAVSDYLQQYPTDERAIALRARALVLEGFPAEAVVLFQQVGAAEIDDLRAWSTALMALGQWEQALPVLRRLIELDPRDGETLERMTICEFESGHRQMALDSGRRLSALPGYEAVGQLQLASMYTAWGSSLEAVRYYKNVLQHRPTAAGLSIPPSDFFVAYADALLSAGNARQAAELLEQTNQLPSSLDITLRKGLARQACGDSARAREYYEAVLRQQADHREARLRLAELALQKDDAASAVALLEKLVELNRLNANGAYLLLRAHTTLGNETQIETWQAKTTELRFQERQLRALQAEAADHPATPRAVTISAYVAAANQDWKTASQLLGSLLRGMPEAYEVPFVQELVDAVRTQGTLPSLDSLPKRPAK